MTRHPVNHLGTLPGGGLRPSPVGLAGSCLQGAVVYPRAEAGNGLPAIRRGTRGFVAKGRSALAGGWAMIGSDRLCLDTKQRRADLRGGGALPGR